MEFNFIPLLLIYKSIFWIEWFRELNLLTKNVYTLWLQYNCLEEGKGLSCKWPLSEVSESVHSNGDRILLRAFQLIKIRNSD